MLFFCSLIRLVSTRVVALALLRCLRHRQEPLGVSCAAASELWGE